MSIEMERQAFEAWFLTLDSGLALDGTVRLHMAKEIYWSGWQARATRPAQTEQQPAIPVGWKLIPIKPTQEMQDAGRELFAAGQVALAKVFRAMVDAAPIAQTAPQPEQSGLAPQLYPLLSEWKPKSRKEMDAKNAAATLLMDAMSAQGGER